MISVVQIYVPEDCGNTCDCASAAECKFKRCENCDGIIGDDGKTLRDDSCDEHRRCPDCGGCVPRIGD